MRYFFEYDAKNKIMRLSFEGCLTDAGLWAPCSIAVKYFVRKPACRSIVSFLDVTSFEVSPEVVKSMTRSAPAVLIEFPVIVVASQKPIYGMARLFATLGENKRSNITVVRSMQEAHNCFELNHQSFSASNLEA